MKRIAIVDHKTGKQTLLAKDVDPDYADQILDYLNARFGGDNEKLSFKFVSNVNVYSTDADETL